MGKKELSRWGCRRLIEYRLFKITCITKIKEVLIEHAGIKDKSYVLIFVFNMSNNSVHERLVNLEFLDRAANPTFLRSGEHLTNTVWKHFDASTRFKVSAFWGNLQNIWVTGRSGRTNKADLNSAFLHEITNVEATSRTNATKIGFFGSESTLSPAFCNSRPRDAEYSKLKLGRVV